MRREGRKAASPLSDPVCRLLSSERGLGRGWECVRALCFPEGNTVFAIGGLLSHPWRAVEIIKRIIVLKASGDPLTTDSFGIKFSRFE